MTKAFKCCSWTPTTKTCPPRDKTVCPPVCASVLSEFVDEEVDLGGLGRMMAMTSNDDLNRLASLEFAADFGRANVYQLLPHRREPGHRRTTSTAHIEGRFLFSGSLNYEQLEHQLEAGGKLKKTNITDEFTYENYPPSIWPNRDGFVVIASTGKLEIVSTGIVPKSGDVVVSLVAEPVQPQTVKSIRKSVSSARSVRPKPTAVPA